MEPLYKTEVFVNTPDIQDFLSSSLNSEDSFIQEPASFPLYDERLNIFFNEKEETGNSNPDLTPVTKTIQKVALDKKKYQNISNELRLELIDAVRNRKEKIKHAAKRLGINYSSAKYIYQIYKREGRKDKIIFKRKSAREEISDHEQHTPSYTNNISNVFSAQNYSFSRQERDVTIFYQENQVVTKDLPSLSVQQANAELSVSTKEDLTEKTQLTNSEISATNLTEINVQPFLSGNPAPSIQVQPVEASQSPITSNQGQLHPLPNLSPMNPIMMPAQAFQSNGMYFAIPQNYIMPYQVQAINLNPSMQIPNNQNNSFIPNTENVTNQSPPQNIQPGQQNQYYPMNSIGNQYQNAQFIQPPVYIPQPYNIAVPMHSQLPPNAQIYIPGYNMPFSQGHMPPNQMGMPTMMMCLPEHQNVTNAQNTQIDNR